MVEYKGTCLCGAVELTVRKEPIYQLYCHCEDCRRFHSNSFIPYVMFTWEGPDDPTVQITKGEDVVGVYNHTPRVERCFCKTCGSAIINKTLSMNFVGTFPVLLKDIDFKPTMHCFYGQKIMSLKDGLPKYRDIPAHDGGSGELLPE